MRDIKKIIISIEKSISVMLKYILIFIVSFFLLSCFTFFFFVPLFYFDERCIALVIINARHSALDVRAFHVIPFPVDV